ncbi:hypothetical protein ScPMuIL_011288 [Solemya velum]
MALSVAAYTMSHVYRLCVILLICFEGGSAVAPIYGPYDGDIKLPPNTNQRKLPLPLHLHYAGQSFQNIYISTDGVLGFSQEGARFRAVLWESGNFADTGDVPMIAPYHYKGPDHTILPSQSSNSYQGEVRYRLLVNITHSDNGNTPETYENLGEFGQYIRNNVVGSDDFDPVWGLVVTWLHVTSYADLHSSLNGCNPMSSCRTGTFQAVLLADHRETYAIFNYGVITLSDHFNQAGFNHGKRRGWTPVRMDNTVLDISRAQGSTTPGRYIFKISDDVIVRGGCYSGDDNRYNFLETFPGYGGMFGGDMIDVTGPCITGSRALRCRFGSVEVDGIVNGSVRARCPVPKLTERGRIPLSVAINGRDFNYHGTFHVVLQDRMEVGVIIIADERNPSWYGRNPGRFPLRWNYRALTDNPSDLVNIYLIGYREDNSKGIWTELEHLATDVRAGSNGLEVDTTSISCRRTAENCNLFEIGIIEVRLSQPDRARRKRALYTHVIPLGWYVGSYQSEINGGTGGAVHCVRSVHPTADGAGNQCCYARDGSLRFAADSFNGSTPDRSHSWGATPYARPGHVPTMSHWLKDVITFYYCCIWTGFDGDCHHYMDERPTRDCRGYSPPKPAAVYGQGHIRSFDGSPAYHMFGTGDFILLRNTDLTLHGRFEQNPFNTTLGPSVLTSIGVHERGEKILEIRMRPPSFDRSKYLLDVLVNHTYHFFDRRELFWQDFHGYSIVNTNLGENKRHSNFTIITKYGAGIQVADYNNLLHLQVMIPPTFKGSVEGLLGDWDDDVSNDKRFQNGRILSGNDVNDLSNFQLSWAVKSKNESLISDFHRANTSFAAQKPPVVPVRLSRGFVICGTNSECLYDYNVTGNTEIAKATLRASQWYDALQSFAIPVRSCGLLDVPYSTKDNTNYTLGSTVTVEGCRKGVLTGSPLTYECTAEGSENQQWSPSVSAKCEVSVDDADVGMIVGIALGCLVGLVVIGIIVAVVIRKTRRAKGSKNTGKSDAEKGGYGSEMEPMRNRPIVRARTKPYSDEKPPHSDSKAESDTDE